MVICDRLSSLPLFAWLPPSEAEMLRGHTHEREYRKGSVFFAQGDPGQSAFFVQKGRVKLSRLTAEGHEQVLSVYGPGDLFGIIPILDRGPYVGTAEATENTRVWVIRHEYLRELIQTQPGFAFSIMREAGAILRQAQNRAVSIAALSVQERLGEYLLEQAALQAEGKTRTLVPLCLRMTHQELGSLLGTSRESISRVFAALRRAEILSCSTDETCVLNVPALRAWLEDRPGVPNGRLSS